MLGLPRGGVPVAAEVAAALEVPLDLFLVRKLGVPGQPELAMGAIAEGGVEVLSEDLIKELNIAPEQVRRVAARERAELDRREVLYRGTRAPRVVTGLTVILVDDGLATGLTMQAAIVAVRRLDPAHIIAAAPVAARETMVWLARYADEVVAVMVPEYFRAVGLWYDRFDQTSDAEVEMLLAATREPQPPDPPAPSPQIKDKL